MTINQLWRMLAASRWLVLICVTACVAGALTFAFRLPKTYEAKARVLLDVVQPDQVTGVTPANSKTFDTYVRTQALLAVGGRTAGLVVDKLGWATNPAVIDAWNEATGGSGDIRDWASQIIQQNMTAYPLENGGTLEIIYHAPDPDAAQAIVAVVRDSYIQTSLALSTEAAARRADRLEELAGAARDRLRTAEAALAAQQRAAGIVVNASGEDIERTRLSSLQSDTITQRTASTQRVTASSARLSKDLLTKGLQTQLTSLDEQIASGATQLGANNPAYRSLLDRRRQVAAQLATANAAARAVAGNVGSIAQNNIARADADFARERARVMDKAPTDARLAQALRMVELRRGESRRLDSNVAALRLQAARTESGLVVLGDVIPNYVPVSPNIPLIGVLSVLFGLGLGIASAMILGLSNREVLGREDLAFASGVPVLGTVPGNRRERRRWWRAPRWLRRQRERPALGTG